MWKDMMLMQQRMYTGGQKREEEIHSQSAHEQFDSIFRPKRQAYKPPSHCSMLLIRLLNFCRTSHFYLIFYLFTFIFTFTKI
jgi:hypothetical protein